MVYYAYGIFLIYSSLHFTLTPFTLQEFALQHDMPHILTSAKTGDNVKEAVWLLISQILLRTVGQVYGTSSDLPPYLPTLESLNRMVDLESISPETAKQMSQNNNKNSNNNNNNNKNSRDERSKSVVGLNTDKEAVQLEGFLFKFGKTFSILDYYFCTI